MIYSNTSRARKDLEKLKAQMEIMTWSWADCELKRGTLQILDLFFSLKLEMKDTHQHTVHMPEKIWTFFAFHQEAALDSQGFQFTLGEYTSQIQGRN